MLFTKMLVLPGSLIYVDTDSTTEIDLLYIPMQLFPSDSLALPRAYDYESLNCISEIIAEYCPIVFGLYI